jgi:hypothetical protein
MLLSLLQLFGNTKPNDAALFAGLSQQEDQIVAESDNNIERQRAGWAAELGQQIVGIGYGCRQILDVVEDHEPTVTSWGDHKQPFCNGGSGVLTTFRDRSKSRTVAAQSIAVPSCRRHVNRAKRPMLKMLLQPVLMLVVDQLGEAVTHTPPST